MLPNHLLGSRLECSPASPSHPGRRYYDAFRAELDRAPIEHEDDAGLVAGLKQQMEAIETMRNYVAHNRQPTRRTVENYDNARPVLDRMLNEYLERWEIRAEAGLATNVPVAPADQVDEPGQ